jgi:hypothetical protein
MSRALVVLWNAADREKVSRWASKAPPGTRVEFKATKRSIPQNDRLWAFLTEIAAQRDWHGVKLSADDWKLLFMDALKRELRVVPNLAGNGFVNLGRSSSDLSKEEMSDLLELVTAWGVEQGIKFNDPAGIEAAA